MIDVPIAEFPVCALVAHVRHLEAVCSHRKQNIITIHKNENTTTTTNNMTNPFLSLIQHNRKYFKDHGFPKLDEPDDAAGADFKGFCMIVHPIHGLLLLHCTRKKDKGPHYQLPGGHVDKEDFDAIGKICLMSILKVKLLVVLTLQFVMLHHHSSMISNIIVGGTPTYFGRSHRVCPRSIRGDWHEVRSRTIYPDPNK